jgi:hypothetical protein
VEPQFLWRKIQSVSLTILVQEQEDLLLLNIFLKQDTKLFSYIGRIRRREDIHLFKIKFDSKLVLFIYSHRSKSLEPYSRHLVGRSIFDMIEICPENIIGECDL